MHPRLVNAVCRMDVEDLSIAEVWRRSGEIAGQLGLYRPGYHAVLTIVLAERERRAARREALTTAADELWASKGVDYGSLGRRLAATRRPA